MKKEIPIVKRKSLLQQSTKTMSKDIPEFYRSILEASDRGELWGNNFTTKPLDTTGD